MFEKFTKEARQVVVHAQHVAREEHSGSIDGRHLLVSLAESDGPAAGALTDAGLDPAEVSTSVRGAIRAGDPLDGTSLAALGIDLDAVRARTDALFGEGSLDRAGSSRRLWARRKATGHIPFTPDAKKALELSLREALRLKHRGIDSRHLLLGLLRDENGPGARALSDAGAHPERLRHQLENLAA
ncbi:Clp protease N-terminal domain-containing protein [Antribacter gilvus]|uniref:Clp protease N-terminal domain-containing protein n=1 Tax=Antribacter gilvus TaxID=2304675 RepID=UPI000F769ABD|nr:Clp protease N-terminal domain-containing protein [Antribacter gilvus]